VSVCRWNRLAQLLQLVLQLVRVESVADSYVNADLWSITVSIGRTDSLRASRKALSRAMSRAPRALISSISRALAIFNCSISLAAAVLIPATSLAARALISAAERVPRIAPTSGRQYWQAARPPRISMPPIRELEDPASYRRSRETRDDCRFSPASTADVWSRATVHPWTKYMSVVSTTESTRAGFSRNS
jgi:hypothetical protein